MNAERPIACTRHAKQRYQASELHPMTLVHERAHLAALGRLFITREVYLQP